MSDVSDSFNGEQLTPSQAIENLQSPDLGLRVYAAWWLGKFRVNQPGVIERLIHALEDEADRTEAGGYPLRRNAARALGKLGDRRAVPALIESLSCSDFYVREAAAQALEMLDDRTCIPVLVQLLKNEIPGTEPSPVRLDFPQPCDAILEALGTLGAVEAIPLAKSFLNHPVDRVQYSASRALYQLTADGQYGNRLIQALQGTDLQLRRSALADLGAIGYLPAADAIAQTLAENSLKLIALKGLLEHQFCDTHLPNLPDGAIKIMNLMDSLL
jgi:phycocyanobilin lyase alpha subunit